MFGMIEEEDLPAHSLLGASGAYRWLNCPGSFNLTRTMPARRPSIYAARGTLAHRYIEELFPNETEVPVSELGRVLEVDGHVIEVDQDMLDGVNIMLGYLHEKTQVYPMARAEFLVSLDRYFRGRKKKPPVRLYGRCDLAMIAPDQRLLEIVDYKNGVGILVDPEDNPQLLYYAAGVLAAIAEDPDFRDTPITTVKITVVQPHARTTEKIRSWTVSALDVLIWVDEVLIPGVDRCADLTAPLVPDFYCRFCSASFACPALHDKATEMAKRDFADHVLPDDPAVLAEQLLTAERAEIWISALRAYALEQLQKQVRIPGWGLVPTRPVRRWRDEERLVDTLEEMGWDDIGFKREPLSPAQMEKLTTRKRVNWDRHFAPLVESVSSGVKLARDPSITAAEKDFPEDA